MRKILFIGGRYYPKASPNSICMQNIINELPDDEYEVCVLCYKDGLEDKKKARTVKVSRGFIQNMLYKSEEKKGNLNHIVVSALKILQKIKQTIFYFIWPCCDPIVTMREVFAAERIYQTTGYDYLVAIHMPLSSLITAHIMKKRHPDIRYIAYFLDSLSGGVSPRFMKEKTYNRKALKWESKLLKNADNIVFMQSSKKFHERIYNNTELTSRITYLDLPMLSRTYNKLQDAHKTGDILFVYVGSLSLSVRSPEFFLKVFSRVREESWRLLFIGDDTCEMLNEYAKKDKRITVIGRCSHDEAIRYEEQATILLNLGNRNKNLTPSKVFEYMSFGKKIVSTYPVDDETSTGYLQKYPNALLLDERGDVTDAANLLQAFVEQSLNPITFDEIKNLFFANTPEAFINLFQKQTSRYDSYV